jgi:3-methyladenine DNA glycosylase AlkD
MQAYMKSAMPYRGVQSGPVRRICRAIIQAEPLESFAAWSNTAMELWRRAEFREERYAAIELVGMRRHRQYRYLADRDFFIRKGIGWALRAHAWTDPRQVERYVAEHEGRLSGLSRREALKNLARLL